jgi:hypothetical protein
LVLPFEGCRVTILKVVPASVFVGGVQLPESADGLSKFFESRATIRVPIVERFDADESVSGGAALQEALHALLGQKRLRTQRIVSRRAFARRKYLIELMGCKIKIDTQQDGK